MLHKGQPSCWIVSKGVIGMENQCLGLAEAMGLSPLIKRVELRAPWKQLAPFFSLGLSHAFSPKADIIEPPFPDVMIGCGRAGALACLYAHQASCVDGRPKTFTIYIQNPVIAPRHFDLVACPMHDGISGENVVATRGSLHRVTAQRLEQEAEKFTPQFSTLPTPYIAVVIGGSNSVYQLTPKEMEPIARQLAQVARDTGGSLLLTTSRRTGDENMVLLKAALQDVPHYLWDGTGANPYYAMLGLADYILVTMDSVNMNSEACSTGKPVYVIPLAGGEHSKFRQFHDVLRQDGLTRPFDGKLETWSYKPLKDVERVAARAWELMEKGGLEPCS